MKLSPSDLLETVRQMSLEDRRVLIGLLNDASIPIVYLKPDISAKEMIRLVREYGKSHASMPSVFCDTAKEATVDHFINSNVRCPNCETPMMQCESHYRCMNCGNVEHDSEILYCPNCGKKTYDKIDDHPAVTIYRCKDCDYEDQVMKQ